MNDNEKQFEDFVRNIKFDDTSDTEHCDKLEQNLLDAMVKQTRQIKIWRIIMKSQITKLATAAVIIVSVVLGLILILDRGATPAYAVSQTIEAIKDVNTVYMEGEFYRQGKFECWMKFDGDPDKPTHVWLGRTGHNMCKICSPAGVFGLNKRTNAVRFAPRDERGKDWIIKFGSFFKKTVRKSKETDSVQIYNEIDPNSQKELILVHIKTQKREQKFLVDPENKLPISFTTLRDDAPMEMLRKPLALKNIGLIRYNEEPPQGIFDMPENAVIVKEEVDCLVDPDSGLVVDGMTHEEACLAITKQACKAMIDVDMPNLKSLSLFFRLWPPQVWEKAREMKVAGQWVQGYEITGEPYKEGNLWYVPCELKLVDNKTEMSTPMIKFYDMEGHKYAFIIGSKEKGVVD